jgi:hypothetical protein
MTQEELKRLLETSKERGNRHVDELLRDPVVKDAVQRDQRRSGLTQF